MLVLLISLALGLESTSNTNKVLSLLPDLASSCPYNIPKCCTTLLEFSKSGGFCNPVTKHLLGFKYGILKNVVKNACKVIKPFQFKDVSCQEFDSHTYANGTCQMTDVELESERIVGAITWAKAVLAIGNEPGCFDFQSFEMVLASRMIDEPTVMASHGLGTYKGISLVAEYMSLLGPKVNKGFMSRPRSQTQSHEQKSRQKES